MFRPLVLSALVGLGLLGSATTAGAQVVGGFASFGVVAPTPPIVVVRPAPVVVTPVVRPVYYSEPVLVAGPATTVIVTKPIVRVRPFRRVVLIP